MADPVVDVRFRGNSGSRASGPSGQLLTQPVWKRFSYPNEYKQPGVKDLDATI
jgi:hypothetical protein